MGRKRRRGGGGRDRKRKRRDGDENGSERQDDRDVTNNWNIEPSNDAFFAYIKGNEVVPEDEFDAFVASLRTRLPTTFRITPFHYAPTICGYVKEYIPTFEGVEVEGVQIPPPFQIPWYPNGLGWQVNTYRAVLRKTPQLKPFHRFLVNETGAGNLSRQEAVSMIPPFFLDVQPHHKVLDMCAAPGSKTAQIMEMLAGGAEPSTGFVIANDANRRRTYMLTHQIKRYNSPNFVVTNHNAQFFPSIHVDADSPLADATAVAQGARPVLRFDRILADVPCTGSGTLRKSPKLWRNWKPGTGNAMHVLQLQIGLRAAKLLSVGGLMVYSTCSFNPVENEAVVAQILLASEGALELVDVSDQLPQLIRRPGLTTWRVMSNQGDWYATRDEVPDEWTTCAPTLFPPPPEVASDQLHLERCVRVNPHMQNTGGFFIAAIRKTRTFKLRPIKAHAQEKAEAALVDSDGEDEAVADADAAVATSTADVADMDAVSTAPATSPAPTPSEETAAEAPAVIAEAAQAGGGAPVGGAAAEESAAKPKKGGGKKKGGGGGGDDEFDELPFKSVNDTGHFDLEKTVEFFGLDPDSFQPRRLYSRGSADKRVYYMGGMVPTLLDADVRRRLKIINAGVKVFDVKKGNAAFGAISPCPVRLSQEGVVVMAAFVRQQRVVVGEEAFRVYFQDERPCVEDFETWPEVKAQLDAIESGSYLLEVTGGAEAGDDPRFPQYCACWKGINSTNLLVKKEERRSITFRVFGEQYTGEAPAATDAATPATDAATPATDAATPATDAATPATDNGDNNDGDNDGNDGDDA